MDVFEQCREINSSIQDNDEFGARNQLIRLLDFHARQEIPYIPLVNHLIRQLGLYPYLQPENSGWEDRFAYEVFKVDVGGKDPLTLHREQSLLLKKLLAGQSIAVSAPTSFGKSFVIDSFISIRKPQNVIIIVPTIALTDETRRRLYKKFSNIYNIVTTPDAELGDQNICIFPAERAIGYVPRFKEIDILIVDEFYKASADFDQERSPALLRAILKLGQIAKQRYFLAPNVTEINESPFTKGMEFLRLDFNTVLLEKHDLYPDLKDETDKADALVRVLKEVPGKTLIYAGTYSGIDFISNLLIQTFDDSRSEMLQHFSDWLRDYYGSDWALPDLVLRGTGIHNGQMHRSLSQIQIRLFEEREGLQNIVSTSSIIEGVNTSAENVIIWRNRNGQFKLNDFTYRNIIGRGGRMFRHFIGKIFILEEPPEPTQIPLNLEFSEALLGHTDEVLHAQDLTPDQVASIVAYKNEMSLLLGKDKFEALQDDNALQISNSTLVRDIAKNMRQHPETWKGLGYLNSENVNHWDKFLFQIIKLKPAGWDIEWSKFVEFVKILSGNWNESIPQLLHKLKVYDININLFFKLERNATYKLASLINDVSILHRIIIGDGTDISSFTAKLSHAFLPSTVYQLEEYGLPRMISKKLQAAEILDFENQDLTIHQVIKTLNAIGSEKLIGAVPLLNRFDQYVMRYFFKGVQTPPSRIQAPA